MDTFDLIALMTKKSTPTEQLLFDLGDLYRLTTRQAQADAQERSDRVARLERDRTMRLAEYDHNASLCSDAGNL